MKQFNSKHYLDKIYNLVDTMERAADIGLSIGAETRELFGLIQAYGNEIRKETIIEQGFKND